MVIKSDEIKSLLRVNKAIDAVENAFREKGNSGVQMPTKLYVTFKEGDVRTIPAYIPALGLATVKIVNVHPHNPSQYNLPAVMAIIEVLDPDTGYPLAIMDGTEITRYRTAAAAAVSIKYSAPSDSKKLAIIGVGGQAELHALSAANVLNIEKIYITDLDPTKSAQFKQQVEKHLSVDVEIASNAQEAIKEADVIITLTPSTKPIIMNDYLPEGVHICAMGADAPGKQELDPNILKRPDAKIVIDDWEQGRHSREVNIPLSKNIISEQDIYGTICEIVAGKKQGRTA